MNNPFKIAVLTGLISLAIGAALGHAEPNLYAIKRIDGNRYWETIYVIDGEVMVYMGISKSPNNSKPFEAEAQTFEIQNTKDGSLLAFYPVSRWSGINKGKLTHLDGYNLTADYSTSPISLTLEKEPNKGSYWKLPADGKEGSIINNNCDEKAVYLAVGTTEVFLEDYGSPTVGKYLKLTLSPEKTDEFQVEYLDPNDGGK